MHPRGKSFVALSCRRCPDFGDDSSEWARDGECDDPRFEGEGSAETTVDANASNVADKFRAGGYLSHFLDEAIAQGLADDDKNNSITAIELSQYLHERYRDDVKSTRPVDLVRTEMTLGYQHLVVDRGSIGAYDVLFER